MSLAVVTVLNAVVSLLNTQAAGRFNVIGYQVQKKSADTINDNPLVQCIIDSARVDFSRSSRNGPKEHECNIKIIFTVAQPAKLDLATLQDPNSTAVQRAIVLQNLINPAQEAAQKIYDAWSAVFEILDDARNLYLGLPDHSISDKSYSDFKLDEPPPRGGLGILTAISVLSFRIKEAQLGDLGNQPIQVINDSTLRGAGINGIIDDISKAGVIVKNPENP